MLFCLCREAFILWILYCSSPSRSPPLGRSYDSTVSSNFEAYANKSLSEKDEKILELTEKNVELQRQMLEMEENLKAKDELIRARTEAVTLMSADLSARGKTTLDQLEDTRTEMRKMQADFAEREAAWREQRETVKAIAEAKEKKISHLESEAERCDIIMLKWTYVLCFKLLVCIFYCHKLSFLSFFFPLWLVSISKSFL